MCRESSAAVRKARAEPHIMQSSPPGAYCLVAFLMRSPDLRAHLEACGLRVLGPFRQAGLTDPVALSRRNRYLGQGSSLHLRALEALPAPHSGACSLNKKHLLGQPMARGGEASMGSTVRSQTKKRAFVSPQPMGLCCINQLSEEPNTIKPKQSLRLGGKPP